MLRTRWPVGMAAMPGVARFIGLAFILYVAAVPALACGGGDANDAVPAERDEDDSQPVDEVARDFVASLLLTHEDVPGALASGPPEEWQTDPFEQQLPLAQGFRLDTAGWLGTYSRPFLLRSETGESFTIANAAMAFTGTDGPASALASFRGIDERALGAEFVLGSPATDYEVIDAEFEAGEDSYALVLAGPVEGEENDLLSAQIAFRRGPVLGVIGVVGYVPLDETLLADLAGKLDARIQERLDDAGGAVPTSIPPES